MKYKNISNIEHAQPFYFKSGDHAVLLIHGFTGSVSHMRLIGEQLHKSGFTVKGINLLGHGSTLVNMKKISWQLWLEQVENEYIALKNAYKYVSVGGLSMGGVLTLALAEKHGVTAAITYSAPLEIRNPYAKWASPLSKIYPVIKWRTPKERAEVLPPEYDWGYEGFPTSSVGELLGLIAHTKENLKNISSPVLVFQSHGDETISKSSADMIINGVSSKVKEAVWLEEVPHVITISKAYEQISKQTIDFISAQEKSAD